MNEFIIPLNTKIKVPVYQQICEYIKREIQQEKLKAGERLPSARALAKYLSVSRSTIDLSYDQLVSEGYIESIPCKGYYICSIDGLYFPDKKSIQPEEAAKEKKEKPEERWRYDFALNGIAPGGFPHNIWRKLSRQVLSEEQEDLFQQGDPCGESGLREAVAAYLYRARGVHCCAEQVIVGAGNDYLLLLLGTILGKKRRIAMENPTYLTAFYDFVHMGYEVQTVDQDSYGMEIQSLQKSGADTAYVMPSHQFPMGMVMPLKRRLALLEWARRGEDFYIIEDDYDSEFRYKGKPIPALQGFDRNDCVIYMGTFSKSLAPSIRVSYMVLPAKLMRKYQERGHLFSVTVSKVDQKILELFLQEGYYERHLNRMRAVYKNKHDLLLKFLKEMGDICTYAGENAGVHLLLKLTNGLTEQEAVQRAKEAGIKVYGLSEYRVKEQVEAGNEILLGYACMTEEEILNAMSELKKIWR